MSNPTPRKGCRIICDTDDPSQAEARSISSASLRCSRPLCSSQNTGGTPPPHNQGCDGGRSPEGPIGKSEDPPARSLRTQQRAQDHSPPNNRSEPASGLYWVRTASPGQCQCSTHERQQGTFAPELTYEADRRCIQTSSPSAP